MGDNLFKVAERLINNQSLCRLLKYQDKDPLVEDDKHPDVDGAELLHKQIVIIPKFPEDGIEHSFVLAVFDNFTINPQNPDFKLARIRFDVVCPYTEWVINENSLRPYLIMEEIDIMFNQAKLSGIGNLQFTHSTPLVLSPQLAGYSMYYQINEFN
jgi:hypothetical protein